MFEARRASARIPPAAKLSHIASRLDLAISQKEKVLWMQSNMVLLLPLPPPPPLLLLLLLL
jgi:hypothetical protein